MEGSLGVRKGAWSKEEDDLLRACIHRYGEGKWHLVPQRSGLKRCRKSCRLRWFNYIKPTIKRGDFGEDEIDIMIRLHKLLGNRWSLIAGRLPGRTSNDVKNFWNSNMRKNKASNEKPKQTAKTHVVFKPQARTFSKNSPWVSGKLPLGPSNQHQRANNSSSPSPRVSVASAASPQPCENWWERLLEEEEPGNKEGDITCCLSGPGGNFIDDLWVDDGEFTEMTTMDNGFVMEDPICWSDFLPLDTNLCGSPS